MMALKLCEYGDLWREGARDAKTLSAWALIEGLSREGVLQQALEERRKDLEARRNDSRSL
jgi:ADP-sugar diphosphatase